jgi:hypothetical protein
MNADAGLVSIGGYLPGKKISAKLKKHLVSFLKTDTLLLPEYIEKNLIAAGDTVLMASSGAGENYIAILQKVPPRLIRNIHAFL